jgi:hypothetical protein
MSLQLQRGRAPLVLLELLRGGAFEAGLALVMVDREELRAAL